MRKLVMVIAAVIMSFTLLGCGENAIEVSQYTLEYLDYDGTVLQTEDYDVDADLNSVTAPTDPERTGYTFDSWSGTVPATMGEETVTLSAMYTINQYIVEYVDYDGTVLQTEDYDFGVELSGVIAPNDPERVGYTFDSWSGTMPVTMGPTNVTITATYTANQYTVEYIDYDGTVLQTADYEYGTDLSSITAPTEPTRLGYTFYRWRGTVPETMEATKVTITALYTINRYTIRYNLDGGINHVGNVTAYNIESKTITLESAKKSGGTFLGWYDNSSFRGFPVTSIPHGSYENITLYAKWDMEDYTVEYVDYDGTGLQITAYDTGADLSGVTAPADPVRNGYTFDSWSGTVPATMGTTKVTITATYTINQYTISYNLDGGINDLGNIATYNIEDNTFTLLIPTKEGFAFSGWYDTSDFSGEVVTEIQTGSFEDITLYAKWEINQFAVEYIDYDGTVLQTKDYESGTILGRVTAPADPVRDGYTFDSWSGTIPTTMGTANVTIKATYTINQYTISYNLDGGINDIGNLATYNIEDNTFTLLAPTKDEATFVGWYDTSDFSGSVVTNISIGSYGDITLYAKWEINEYITVHVRVDSFYDPTNQFNLAVGETITSVSSGYSHSLALTSEGRVFTWGWNYYGVLGDGTTTHRSVPTEITNQFNLAVGETITSVSLRTYHSSAVTSEGRIFTWGRNEYGQLGDGTTEDKTYPTDITNEFNLAVGETIMNVLLGYKHSSALTSEGRLFTWGYNGNGQLGDGTTLEKHVPTEITNQFNLAVGETIMNVSVGSAYSSALTSEGRLFTWGYNSDGQLGDGTTLVKHVPTEITNQFNLAVGETITSVSLGSTHSSALTSEGRLFTWGYNDHGELGNGTTLAKHVPTEITNQFNLAVGETITSVSLGYNHSSALTSEGRLFIWGYNNYGQLGDGTTLEKHVPTEIMNQFNLAVVETITFVSLGGIHSLAVTSEGRIFTWGRNEYGQLGDGTTEDKTYPTDITYHFYYIYAYDQIVYEYDSNLTSDFISYVGYTFDGWYTDSDLSHPYTGTLMPNYPLYALYIEN